MKRNIFFILGIIVLVTLCGCSKGKFCKCTSQEEDNTKPDVRIINVDWGVSCKNITEMGIERQTIPEGEKEPTLVREMRDFVCEHVKSDEASIR